MSTHRPFVPIGSFATKKAAETAAKIMTEDTGNRWIPCKGGRVQRSFAGKTTVAEGFAIVRKDAA